MKMNTLAKQFLSVLAVITFVYFMLQMTLDYRATNNPLVPGIQSLLHTYVVDTPGCKMAYLDPWDPLALEYIYAAKPVVCGIPLILSNQTMLWVNQKLSLTLKYNGFLKCCYESFNRQIFEKDDGSKQDHKIKMSGKCKPFEDSTPVYDEFVEVRCTVNKTEVYKDYHAFMVRKRANEVIKRLDAKKKPNVIIIGIDAVSKPNSARQIPRTLKRILAEGAIEFHGFNKVGDNTFPNIMPLFTGYSVEELQDTCWKDTQDKFDQCHFIWSDFKEAGYLTAFAEDTCWMGLFLYVKRGFFKQPTDYYTQAFMKLNEDKIGNQYVGNAYLCCGNRLALEVLFDYTEKFATNMTKENLPFFGHFWGTSLSHDSLNMAVQADDIYEKLFIDLKNNGVLNSSIVIFMSDHGLRWGSFRSTYQGRLEDRLPFFYLMLPDWFKEEYTKSVEHLKVNTRRLVTTFDLHETLKDIIDISQLTNDALCQRMPHANQRGLSLFMPIPTDRTCESAGVPEEYCTCYESRKMTVDHSVVVDAANAIAKKLNTLLKGYSQCSWLYLNKVLSATEVNQRPDGAASNEKKYQIMVEVDPGGGQFEGTVTYDIISKKADSGKISRTNAYGNTSYCIEDAVLRLYCYCKEQLKT